ncbi:phosphotransferase enzyme family protein [Streptomyces marincola]|uniref:phosphotransferase enzyme family protein n=1 Tax=Streptomyces marincola TaxID=2878388 RepID=UPI001CF1A77C|nr:aminoglycoside phosphotransferase family protein [Streptomyces marincola]UCM88727.1 aminoglycoside phosphotransferase family protein [Streptomyces marincola]
MSLTAAAIASAFGLGRPRGPMRPLANGGQPPSSWVLTTTGGRWVVKADRLSGAWRRRHAERVHRLESAALTAGIPSPRPVEPPAPAIGYWHHPQGHELVRVSEWVEGHDLRHLDVAASAPTEAASWVGATLGRVALLGTDRDAGPQDEPALHPLTDWRAWVAEAEAANHPVAAPARSLLPVIEDATALVALALRDGPGRVLVHGDTSRANVLRTATGYSLIDWEGARADVPWWEAVNVAFRFATPFNGPTAVGDPRVVRPLLEAYLAQGAPGGRADTSAFAGLLRSQLTVIAWWLWQALGHRGAHAAQRQFGLRIVASAAEGMPHVMRSLDSWAALLR